MTIAAPPLPDTQPLKAAAWMCGAIASFTLMAISGRAIQAELNSFELMFWRSLIGFAIIGTLVLTLHGRAVWPVIRPTSPRLHLARNIFHFAGQNLWFYGIMMIPLSQLVALEFTSPIWVAVLAPLVVGEVFTRRRLWVALLGFTGILIVAQPGLQPLSGGHLAGVLCAVAFALNLLLTKRIMRHDAVLCVLFWMTALQTLFGLALAQWGGFTWPSAAIWGWIGLVGITGLSAHYCLTSALGLAPATIVAPMEFFRLPIIALVGMWLYAEALDPFVFLGGAVIFAANWLNLSARKARNAAH
ncbi:MAG: EamA family transporter [Alphaproteobacteria bacterium]|jgi:drug/metabolite transporter (DMT)-like permease|nr:EamA family transporter [Alphaproteobacteria bacterium]